MSVSSLSVLIKKMFVILLCLVVSFFLFSFFSFFLFFSFSCFPLLGFLKGVESKKMKNRWDVTERCKGK